MRKKAPEIALFSIYALVTLFCLINHEPWRDEAQAWLIVRDLDLPGIIAQMGYEGTPALWHLLIFPLTRLGLPYQSMLAMHWLIALAAMYLLVFYAPFPRITKALIAFSYYFVFEYSVVARNYAISVLILFLIAFFYNRRHEKPLLHAILIFFLFNTNVHSFGPALALMLIYAVERAGSFRSSIASLLVMFSGAAAAIAQLATNNNAGVKYPTGSYNILFDKLGHIDRVFISFVNSLIPDAMPSDSGVLVSLKPALQFLFGGTITEAQLSASILVIWLILLSISAAALTFFIITVSARYIPLFFMSFSFASLFAIFVFFYRPGLRHSGLLLVILIFTYWVYDNYNDNRKPFGCVTRKTGLAALSAFLTISVILGVAVCVQEYKSAFSGSKEMAGFIKKNSLSDNVISAYSWPEVSAVLPYFAEKRFWDPDIDSFVSFTTWNRSSEEFNRLSAHEIIGRTKTRFGNNSKTLILFSRDVEVTAEDEKEIELLYKTIVPVFRREGARSEQYRLFKFR